MRASLLLSVAAATLSLYVSQGFAQSAARDEKGSESTLAGKSETVGSQRKTKKHGAAKKSQERRGAEAKKTEEPRRAESEKAGSAATDDKGAREHGATADPKPEPDSASGVSSGNEPQTRARIGRGERTSDEQGGAAKADQNRRGAENETTRAPPTAQRGDSARDEQQGRDIVGRSPDTERPRAETAPPRSDERESIGRTEREGRERAAASDENPSLRLSARDQTRLRDTIERTGGARVSRNAFDVRIGAMVPQSVQLYPLPPDAVAIVPQYRGYDFVRVEDQIAIIDPDRREVVTMLQEGGAPPAAYGARDSGYEGTQGERYGSARPDESERRPLGEAYGFAPPVRLDSREERALYRSVMQDARTNLRQVCLHVGDRVPDFVDIAPVPRQIADETPNVARFDYFVLNDQVVLVNPDSRQVVEIIEEPR